MNLFLILSLAALVYVLVWGVIYLFGARKRSWIMAVVRLGITVVSAIASIPLSKLFAGLLSDVGYDLLISNIDGGLADLLEKVPVGAEGMRVIASLIAAPILYVLVFLTVRFVIAMIMWIVEKFVPVLKKRSATGIAMPLGGLNGILIAVVTLIPLCGFMALGSGLLGTLNETHMMETATVREILPAEVDEEDARTLAYELETHPLVTVVHGTVGEPVFNALTTADLDATNTHGKTVTLQLEDELCGLVALAGNAVKAVDSFEGEDYTAEDKELLFATADSMFASEWVTMLVTDTLTAMSESWLNNDTFMDMKRPSLDASLNPTVNRVLEILSDETSETLEEDIHIILDVVGDLMVNDILTDDMDYTELVQRMGQDGLLTSLLAKLDANSRLYTLSVELKNLSIRLVTNMLGTELLESGQYDGMMENVASSLNDVLDLPAEERDAIIIESIRENFSAEGYDVPDDVALEMSNKMIDELGADGEITADELKEYMLAHADEGFDVVGDDILDELT